MQDINLPKYVGIMENYLCFHRVRKAPRLSRAGCDVALFNRMGYKAVPRFTGKTRITGKTVDIPERPKNDREILMDASSNCENFY